MFRTKNDFNDIRRSIGSFSILSIGFFYLIIELTFFMRKLSGFDDITTFIFQVMTIFTTMSLIFSGIWLYSTNFRNDSIYKITSWVLFGVIFVLGVSILNILFQQKLDGTILFDEIVMMNNSSAGGFISLLVGLYHANSSEKAEKVEKEKKENELLHSLLTHDLRNKLQIMNGKLHLIKENTDLDKKQRKAIDESIETGEKVIELSKKVRKTVKSSTKKESYKVSKIKDLIKKEIKEIKDQDVEVFFADNASNSEVIGGPILKEIISNLLENALKHSGCEKIVFTLDENEDELIICVEDDGKGVPNNKKREIFELGYTETGASAGFGLFLIKKVLNRFNGRIEVEDSDLGGAKFEIFLKKT